MVKVVAIATPSCIKLDDIMKRLNNDDLSIIKTDDKGVYVIDNLVIMTLPVKDIIKFKKFDSELFSVFISPETLQGLDMLLKNNGVYQDESNYIQEVNDFVGSYEYYQNIKKNFDIALINDNYAQIILNLQAIIMQLKCEVFNNENCIKQLIKKKYD